MKKDLISNELMASLKQDSVCNIADKINIVCIPPDVDKVNDWYNIDKNIVGGEHC